MISTQDRRHAIALIEEAVAAGARKARACEALGLSVRTVQRWSSDSGVGEDRRASAVWPWRRQGSTVDVVGFGDGDGLGPAGESILGLGHAGGSSKEEHALMVVTTRHGAMTPGRRATIRASQAA